MIQEGDERPLDVHNTINNDGHGCRHTRANQRSRVQYGRSAPTHRKCASGAGTRDVVRADQATATARSERRGASARHPVPPSHRSRLGP